MADKTSTAEHDVRLTHPDRVLFPGGITKSMVADYYRSVADYILPFLRDRPLVMQRFPEGIDEEGFYQNAPDYFPDWIEQIEVSKQDGVVNHVLCNDVDTLIYLVNQGCITFHAWLSRSESLDNPDVMVFDLDPPKVSAFDVVRKGAFQLRDLLKDLGMDCFVQTTGSRGLHVDVPLDGSQDFDTIRSCARRIADTLVESDPEGLTTEHRKSKRGDRVFVDTLRNAYAQTAVAPYSLRARRGAPAATPLNWQEVADKSLKPNAYGLKNMNERLKGRQDPWRGFFEHPGESASAMKKLESESG